MQLGCCERLWEFRLSFIRAIASNNLEWCVPRSTHCYGVFDWKDLIFTQRNMLLGFLPCALYQFRSLILPRHCNLSLSMLSNFALAILSNAWKSCRTWIRTRVLPTYIGLLLLHMLVLDCVQFVLLRYLSDLGSSSVRWACLSEALLYGSSWSLPTSLLDNDSHGQRGGPTPVAGKISSRSRPVPLCLASGPNPK